MKIKILCMMLLWLMLSGNAAAQDKELTQAFLHGIDQYKAGDFADAVQSFQKIADAGIRNGKLFYNLGNAYLKTGKIGPAMLWYERALQLIPDDPDLRFNYEYALTLLKDDRGEKNISIVRILFFWKYMLSPSVVRITALVLNALFWITVTVRLVMHKKLLKTPIVLTLILASVFSLTAIYNYYESGYFRMAVILSEEVPVRSGLSDDATELFRLHAGSKIQIEREKQGYYRIVFTEDKIGWIRSADAGVI